MPKQMITDQAPGGGTKQVEVDVPDSPPLNTSGPTKDYAPDPSRKDRPTHSYGVGEGDQTSDAGSFGGAMFSREDANNMVRQVRQDRLARHVATTRTPTFGETAASMRADQAQQQTEQPPGEPDPEQVAQAANGIKMLVDTRTGHISPVLPGDPDPEPGPHDILMTTDQANPSQPNILAQGKRVTPQALARLSDPKRGIQPTLRPGYKIPEQYAGLAQALGAGGAG